MMKLYFYNDGMEPERTAPKFEFSGRCNHELIIKLDDALFKTYGPGCAALVNFDPEPEYEPQICGLVDPSYGTVLGTIYIVHDQPAVEIEK